MTDTAAEPLSRDALVEMVLHVKTQQDCEMALALANRYLERHPEDLDLATMLEVPIKLLDAYQSGLL